MDIALPRRGRFPEVRRFMYILDDEWDAWGDKLLEESGILDEEFAPRQLFDCDGHCGFRASDDEVSVHEMTEHFRALHASLLQAAVRSKLVRQSRYNSVQADRSPPSPKIPSGRRHTPSPTSSTASAAPTASPGSPASPTLLPSPCSIFPSPPTPFTSDAASAATVLSARARATTYQLQHRASQAAAVVLTAFTRASLTRTGDYNTLSAFARAAPARTGDNSHRTPALPFCPRPDPASNFKFTAAPIDVSGYIQKFEQVVASELVLGPIMRKECSILALAPRASRPSPRGSGMVVWDWVRKTGPHLHYLVLCPSTVWALGDARRFIRRLRRLRISAGL
jgi:hypothetical protein